MFDDHKGYYSILGVQPGATSALVKAAYRVRAMELHPDRNSSASATRETQLLNEAYQVLGEETSRRQYDATCRRRPKASGDASEEVVRPERETQASQHTSTTGNVSEPVICAFCQAVTVQPRYRELTTVFSYLIGSHKSTRRGVFCAACERKHSAQATGITAVAGWWGFYGFFWSMEALAKNMFGSWRFARQDATLSCAQAYHFASKNNLELAHAVAVDSLRLARRPSGLTREQRRRQALGYEMDDSLSEIRGAMVDLIERTERAGCNRELVRLPRIRQASFLIQVGFVLVPLVVLLTVAFNLHSENLRIDAERARIESARLEREGLERQRAKAIADRQAAELATMEQPTPTSGLFHSELPKRRYTSAIGLPGLTVTAPSERSYFIKLSESQSGELALTLFVRAGETAEIRVPFGTYSVSMAAGTNWYGEKIRFGPDTAYSRIDKPLTFSIEGDQLTGHQLQLSLVRNGNLRPSRINAEQF